MARTPLEAFVDGIPPELSRRARRAGLAGLLGGGDESVVANMRASELLTTVVVPARTQTRVLARRTMLEVGHIEADTKRLGRMSLDAFLAEPESRAQGFVVIHHGDIVYEQYPRMRSEDPHLWMSDAKPTAALVIELLIDEGRLDDRDAVSRYVPQLAGSAWDHVRVRDAMDMTAGLDTVETTETRADPDSLATRLFLAEFGEPYRGRVEGMVEVLRSAQRVDEPGGQFDYASANAQALVLIAEAIESKLWSQIFDERVWSKLGAEGPLQVHTSPDGIAAAHGFLSSTLRDHARFGMLYTPSWKCVADEEIVTPEITQRIRESVRDRAFFLRGADGPVFSSRLDDDQFISNARMWDAVWSDGDLWKSGLMGQGLYVSPDRDLVMAFFSISPDDDSIHRFVRPIATSGLFDR